MSKYRMRAAALLAAGALAGGVTAATLTATADDTATPGASTGATATDPDGRPGGPGPGGDHGRGADAAALATALGLDESKVSDALDAVREAIRPDAADAPADGTRPTPPTEAEVTKALDGIRADRQAEARQRLADRLDEAVTSGDLTDADKASVLKAFDTGVLGGRP